MRLRQVICGLSALFFGFPLFAQEFYDRHEFGVALGAAQYFGDLNPEYGFKHIRPAGGGFYRYYFNPYISIRGNVNYVRLGYKDSYSSNPYQKIRNLTFENDVFEASVMGEFNFFYFSTGDENYRFTPYMVAGVGAIYSNPYAMLNDQKFYLRNQGTEGQNLPEYSDRRYSRVHAIIPFGAGVKWWMSSGVNLGFEVVHRFAFTDYLDDVSKTYVGLDKFVFGSAPLNTAAILQDPSLPQDGQKLGRAGKQRGDAATIDQYLMAQFTISIQLKTYKCPAYSSPLWNAPSR